MTGGTHRNTCVLRRDETGGEERENLVISDIIHEVKWTGTAMTSQNVKNGHFKGLGGWAMHTPSLLPRFGGPEADFYKDAIIAARTLRSAGGSAYKDAVLIFHSPRLKSCKIRCLLRCPVSFCHITHFSLLCCVVVLI